MCQVGVLCFPFLQNPKRGCQAKRRAGVQEGLAGQVFLPKRECRFPGRAALPSAKQLTHRPQGRVCQGQFESGVPWLTHHRAPRLCRVGRGRDSQETAGQGEESARESPCQTPEVGRQRVAGGSGVTLSLRVGSRPRETKRGAKQRDLTVSPVTKTQRQTQSTTRERTCVPDAQHAARAHVQPTHTWFHTYSLARLLTHSLAHLLTCTHTHLLTYSLTYSLARS